MTCPECEGTGVIVTDACDQLRCSAPSDCQSCPERYKTERCFICDGTGTVWDTVNEYCGLFKSITMCKWRMANVDACVNCALKTLVIL